MCFIVNWKWTKDIEPDDSLKPLLYLHSINTEKKQWLTYKYNFYNLNWQILAVELSKNWTKTECLSLFVFKTSSTFTVRLLLNWTVCLWPAQILNSSSFRFVRRGYATRGWRGREGEAERGGRGALPLPQPSSYAHHVIGQTVSSSLTSVRPLSACGDGGAPCWCSTDEPRQTGSSIHCRACAHICLGVTESDQPRDRVPLPLPLPPKLRPHPSQVFIVFLCCFF